MFSWSNKKKLSKRDIEHKKRLEFMQENYWMIENRKVRIYKYGTISISKFLNSLFSEYNTKKDCLENMDLVLVYKWQKYLKKEHYEACKYIVPKSTKSSTIASWKSQGLIDDDYDMVYHRLCLSTHCELCNSKYKKKSNGVLNRCMEHCHISGFLRSICCSSCNSKDRDFWVI